jgi:rubrerythrin
MSLEDDEFEYDDWKEYLYEEAYLDACLMDPNEEEQEEGQALKDQDEGGRICNVCGEPFREAGQHSTCPKCRQRRHRARMKEAQQITARAQADSLDRWAE